MNVVIRNLPGSISKDELYDLLEDHGVPVISVTLSNEGNTEQSVAAVALDTNHAGAEALVHMMNGRLWHGRTLAARTQTMFTGEGLNHP